jgi:flagellar motor protein MotB
MVFFSLIPLTGCLSSKLNQQFTDENKRLRADSLAQENRIRKLLDEKEYLEHKNATTEQALNLRLQEKEDSLNVKERQLKEREASLMDMKSRKEQEEESFTSLAQSIFYEFKEINPADITTRVNCTKIIVEVSDRLLFTQSSIKVDSRTLISLNKIKEVMLKNNDLQLIIVAHTDTFNYTKQKINNVYELGYLKAFNIYDILTRELGVQKQKITIASRGPVIKPISGKDVDRNRIEFIFYSNLLPCIYNK